MGGSSKPEGEAEVLPVPAVADSTADAVGDGSADGQGGLSDATRRELAALKAELVGGKEERSRALAAEKVAARPRPVFVRTVLRTVGLDAVLVPAQAERPSTDEAGAMLERDLPASLDPAAMVGSGARAPPAAA